MREFWEAERLEASFQLSPWRCEVLPVACSCRELFVWARYMGVKSRPGLRFCVVNLREVPDVS